MKNFSQQVRLGKSDKHSEKRISELSEYKIKLLEFLEEADMNGYRIKIDSVITIEVEK